VGQLYAADSASRTHRVGVGKPFEAAAPKDPLYPCHRERLPASDFGAFILGAFDLRGSSDSKVQDRANGPEAVVKRNLALATDPLDVSTLVVASMFLR
jgi:hypothetical protein